MTATADHDLTNEQMSEAAAGQPVEQLRLRTKRGDGCKVQDLYARALE